MNNSNWAKEYFSVLFGLLILILGIAFSLTHAIGITARLFFVSTSIFSYLYWKNKYK